MVDLKKLTNEQITKLIDELLAKKEEGSLDLITAETMDSFIEYGKLVILSRSFPRVEDGLKPVHRRILYGMKGLSLTPTSPHKKSARITGLIIGSLHPHGDNSVYDAMVRMAQDFSMRSELVDGQGNFGTVDGDSAASSRYCVTGDTLIKTTNGLIPIKDLVKDNSPQEQDVEGTLFSLGNKINKYTKFFNVGKQDIYSLKTNRGYSVRGTPNHPVLTLTKDKDGKPNFYWKLMENIKEGDYVVIDRSLTKSTSEITSYLKNEAIIWGCLVSEGSYSEKRITFNNTDKEYYDDFIKAFRDNYDELFYSYERELPSGKKIYEFDIQNSNSKFFKSNTFKELKTQKSKDKEIPSFVLRSTNNEVKKIFLSYLFEGDGSIYLNKRDVIINVSYSTISEKLSSDIQLLLLDFGISSKRQYMSNRSEIKLELNSFEEVSLFLDRIGFATKKLEKSKHDLNYVLKNRHPKVRRLSKNHIPYISDYIRSKYSNENVKRYNIDRYLHIQSDNFINKIRPLLSKEDTKLYDFYINLNYLFDEVKVIEKEETKENAYSVKVDNECHSFIGGGIINHNTEATVTKAGYNFFSDLDKNVVPVRDNYDETTTEPVVLPVKYPNLLINGTEGIGVGLATYVPPHSPEEVIEVTKYIVDCKKNKEDINIDHAISIFKGPDFPTGGIIYDNENWKNTFLTGNGKIKLRSSYFIEENKRKKSIVIDSIPYQVQTTKVFDSMKKILKEDDSLKKSISAIRDESSKEGIRIVLDLKIGSNPEMIWFTLLKKTNLDISVSYNPNVINSNNKPERMSPLRMIEEFIQFRVNVINSKYIHIKKEAELSLELINGYIKALDIMDTIIKLIRGSEDDTEAFNELLLLDFTERQAKAILNMRLNRLTKMEKDTLEKSKAKEESTIKHAEGMIKSDAKKYNEITKDLNDSLSLFSRKERLSKIDHALEEVKEELTVKKEDFKLHFSEIGYLYKETKKAIEMVSDDHLRFSLESNTHATILFITESGIVYGIKALDLDMDHVGSFIDNVLTEREHEDKIVNIISIDDFDEDKYLLFASEDGYVKRTKLSEFTGSLRKTGIVGSKAKKIIFATNTCKNGTISMLSSENKIIRYPLEDVSIMGRSGRGVTGMKFDGEIVAVTCKEGYLLTIDDKGVLKGRELSEFKEQKRAGKGVWVHGKSGVHLTNGMFLEDISGELVVEKVKTTEKVDLAEYKNRILGEKGYKAFKLLQSDSFQQSYINGGL